MKPERIEIRVDSALLLAINGWRRAQDDFPGKSEAVRRLLEQGLAAAGISREAKPAKAAAPAKPAKKAASPKPAKTTPAQMRKPKSAKKIAPADGVDHDPRQTTIDEVIADLANTATLANDAPTLEVEAARKAAVPAEEPPAMEAAKASPDVVAAGPATKWSKALNVVRGRVTAHQNWPAYRVANRIKVESFRARDKVLHAADEFGIDYGDVFRRA